MGTGGSWQHNGKNQSGRVRAPGTQRTTKKRSRVCNAWCELVATWYEEKHITTPSPIQRYQAAVYATRTLREGKREGSNGR